MSRTPRLTASDVDRLAADRSAQARIETMTKLVEELSVSRLEPRELDLAREVLERFARDAEIAVREAVAWQIHNTPLLTGDLARRLAGDNGPSRVVAFAAEAGQFQEAGFSTVICGPGSIDQAHQPDEFVEVSQMERGAAFMSRLVDWAARGE